MAWWDKLTSRAQLEKKPEVIAAAEGAVQEPVPTIHSHLWDEVYAGINAAFARHGENGSGPVKHDATTMAAVAIVAVKTRLGVDWDKAVALAKRIDPFH